MPAFADLFATLRPPRSDGAVFSAASGVGLPRYRIACDPRGRPAILINPVVGDQTAGAAAGIELRSLTYWPSATCEVVSDEGTSTDTLAVIWCTSPDEGIKGVFLHVADTWIEALGTDPTCEEITLSVDWLARLFQSLGRPTDDEVKGLWGELLLIAGSREPAVLAAAWHEDPRDIHDFAAGDRRLEVKVAAGSRRHYFSMRQLSQLDGITLVVASILVQEDRAGRSIADLSAQAKGRLDEPLLRLRIDEVVCATLGHEWQSRAMSRFSLAGHLITPVFFEASAIPTVPAQHVPPEVSDVRFRADLSHVPVIGSRWLVAQGGLFEAACPIEDSAARLGPAAAKSSETSGRRSATRRGPGTQC